MRPTNPPDGTSVTVTVSLGPTTANLTGTVANDPGGAALTGANLAATNGGRTIFSGSLKAPNRAPAVIPLNIGPTKSSASVMQPLCLARFAGGTPSQPTVLVGLYSGGAHCCTVLRALSLPSGSLVDDNLGNPSASVTTEGNRAIVVTANDAFNYAFTDYAHSGTPIEVLEFQGGQFVNTTGQHQRLVASDAQKWMQLFNSQPDNGLGYLAAWVADECVAGQGAQAWATVDQLRQQARLPGSPFSLGGSSYVRDLHQLLDRQGYCR
jgi:hypothetical protein